MKERRRKKDIDAVCESILRYIQPGDVINQVGGQRWWEFWLAVAQRAIQHYQRQLFGEKSSWQDTHTMLYLDEENTFSVEAPRARKKPLRDYCFSEFSIYRLTLIPLSVDHIDTLREAAAKIVGTKYDYGQLLDIAVNQILGFEHQRRLSVFDLGKRRKVCSVGVRTAFEYLYKNMIRTEDSPPGKWLFREMNPKKWPREAVRRYRGTDVEATSPAHFSNSDYFCHDFELVARFTDGVQVFPDPSA
jgi:hypothetical protein